MSQVDDLEGVEDSLAAKIDAFMQTLDASDQEAMKAILGAAGQNTPAVEEGDDDTEGFIFGFPDACTTYSICWYSCIAARGRHYLLYCGDYCHRKHPGC